MLFAIISYLLDDEVNAAAAVLCICYYGRCRVHADIVSWLVCSSVFAVHFLQDQLPLKKIKYKTYQHMAVLYIFHTATNYKL